MRDVGRLLRDARAARAPFPPERSTETPSTAIADVRAVDFVGGGERQDADSREQVAGDQELLLNVRLMSQATRSIVPGGSSGGSPAVTNTPPP